VIEGKVSSIYASRKTIGAAAQQLVLLLAALSCHDSSSNYCLLCACYQPSWWSLAELVAGGATEDGPKVAGRG